MGSNILREGGKVVQGKVENMSILPKLTYKLIAIPIQSPQKFFIELDKLIWTSMWKRICTRRAKTIFEEKEQWRLIHYIGTEIDKYMNKKEQRAPEPTHVQILNK